MSEAKKQFGESLRLARFARGLKQQGLADASGVDIATISHYERGQGLPGSGNLMKLAQVLDVTLDFLMGDQNGTVEQACQRALREAERAAEIRRLRARHDDYAEEGV